MPIVFFNQLFLSSQNFEPLCMRPHCLRHALSSFLTPIPCANNFRLRQVAEGRRVKLMGKPINCLLDLEALCNWGNEEIGFTIFTRFFEGHTHALLHTHTRTHTHAHTRTRAQMRTPIYQLWIFAYTHPQLSRNGATYPIFIDPKS